MSLLRFINFKDLTSKQKEGLKKLFTTRKGEIESAIERLNKELGTKPRPKRAKKA